jgi:hypothetical protein
MTTLPKFPAPRSADRATTKPAPATLSLRLLRPNLARGLLQTPIRHALQKRGAFGITRSITFFK